MGPITVAVLAVLALVVTALIVVRRRRVQQHRLDHARAIESFQLTPQLESTFLAAANATGKPRGLRWMECRLEGSPVFALDRTSGELFALVNATVRFEAVEGGDMEEVEAVGNLRAATAVFVHRAGGWTTDGRVVFNLDPAQTLRHYGDHLAAVDLSETAS